MLLILRERLTNQLGSRDFERLIDERGDGFDKAYRVRKLCMYLECSFMDPVRMNVEQLRISYRSKRVNVQTARLCAGVRNDFTHGGTDGVLLARASMKPSEDVKFR